MASEYPAIMKCFLDAVGNFANPQAQMWRKLRGTEPPVWESMRASETMQRDPYGFFGAGFAGPTGIIACS